MEWKELTDMMLNPDEMNRGNSDFIVDCNSISPDTSNIYNKRQFTFLIEAFLKAAVKSPECSLCEEQYDELMEFWERL
jgi:hypothetical protein